MEFNTFQKNCYSVLLRVPLGKVTTYKAIATKLNSRAYRLVGRAMKLNKDIPNIPCHRVIASNGQLGGYSGGMSKKIKLLKKEGIQIRNNKINLKKYQFNL